MGFRVKQRMVKKSVLTLRGFGGGSCKFIATAFSKSSLYSKQKIKVSNIYKCIKISFCLKSK